jgi:hypothetical protein
MTARTKAFVTMKKCMKEQPSHTTCQGDSLYLRQEVDHGFASNNSIVEEVNEGEVA